MPLFQPITSATGLPALGASREALALDFKRDRYDVRRTFEIAKDAAAFANATGGVVLVGAEENVAAGVLLAYRPIAEEATAAQHRVAINQTIRDRCHPIPLVDVAMIAHPDGGYVIAMNVWPFPAQAIGVRVTANRDAEGFGGDAYVFPIRVGTDTQFLRAEQLPMLMVPTLRTAAILLDQIRENEPVLVLDERGFNADPGGLTFKRVDVQACSFTLGLNPRGELTIPLDAVRSVWRTGDKWRIALEGLWGPGPEYHRTNLVG